MMITSMTGFGSRETQVAPFGKVRVELRSTNHRFLEIVFHLPEGFLVLEDKLKKEIEAKMKRGRVVCVINIIGANTQSVFINKALLKNYIMIFKKTKQEFQIKDDLGINTLIHLPGVLSLAQDQISKAQIWPRLKILANQALADLVKIRQKEGRALQVHLNKRAEALQGNLGVIKVRFKKVIKEKLAKIKTDEERSSFLKNTDISEEIERLGFHIEHFADKILKSGPVGKELDFIAQEMQREANTMGSKSCDAVISAQVVQIKSQIEKIREQVQNIE